MRENSMVSNYTVAQYKVHKTKSNDANIPNLVDRDLSNKGNTYDNAVSEATNKIKSGRHYKALAKSNILY